MTRRPLVAPAAASAAAALALAAAAGCVHADEPSAVPYRPTAANPADLPAAGYAEMEFGYLHGEGGDPPRTDSLPTLLKFGIDDRFAFLVGTDAWSRQREADGSTVGSGGDVALTLKQRIAVRDGLAFGLEYAALVPAARPPIGVDKTDFSVNSIASIDIGNVRVDANLEGIRVGAPDAGEGRARGFAAVAASLPLDDKFTLGGDVHGNLQHGTTPDTTVLGEISYAASRRVVFDVAAMAGIARAAPHWQVTAGVTVLLGRWL
jgi:hypothetical protein